MTKLSQKKFNTLLNERSVLNDKINALKEEVAEKENIIKEYLESNGLEEYASDLYKVTYSEVISMRFNDKQLIKDKGQEFYEKYKTKAVSSTPFHVYPIKK